MALARAARGTLDVVHSTKDSRSLSAAAEAAESLGGFDFVDMLLRKRMETVYATLADRPQHDPERKFTWVSTVAEGYSGDRETRVQAIQERGFEHAGQWEGLLHFRKPRA